MSQRREHDVINFVRLTGIYPSDKDAEPDIHDCMHVRLEKTDGVNMVKLALLSDVPEMLSRCKLIGSSSMS